ncbi:hypothetical protein [Saccharothrix sp. NRRL B-16314]|uniref:hypothetical protein n=1 Tax=Saccharothrix sp. NRRL B-16314 TaxID=1463825 RepID=UPI0005270B18|nr:hypothetical protein [Saccharothrix sp. NRRL B-16314]
MTARIGSPARLVVLGFGGSALLGALLLVLPVATEDGSSAGVVTALFTATSAVCMTGLVVVDTATHWSTFGEVVVLVLIQPVDTARPHHPVRLRRADRVRRRRRHRHRVVQPGHAAAADYAAADTVVREGDILIVAGRTDQVEVFADLT